MRIIKNGSPTIRVISNDTPEKICCDKCGCVFEYSEWDIHCTDAEATLYIDYSEHIYCPWCNEYIVLLSTH